MENELEVKLEEKSIKPTTMRLLVLKKLVGSIQRMRILVLMEVLW